MQSIENKIVTRIQGKARGACFTPKAFLDLGSPEAVRIALYRLEKRGTIRRLTRGLYDRAVGCALGRTSWHKGPVARPRDRDRQRIAASVQHKSPVSPR